MTGFNDVTQHRRVVSAHFGDKEIKQLLARELARRADVALELDTAKVTQCWITSSSNLTGTEYGARVEITVQVLAGDALPKLQTIEEAFK